MVQEVATELEDQQDQQENKEVQGQLEQPVFQELQEFGVTMA